MYELTIKSAFKVDYGHKFLRVGDGGINDYQPDDEEEIE